ncbi:YbaB/EbfC family nucleoid-associated protein [Lentzea sp. NPDC051213]|uniref:YbaB/EbfC family nucleoid-associated protein n=1 Tax=Lentzea sp. NPDC051213 TaxID=3364126 RepID=UPI0037931D08
MNPAAADPDAMMRQWNEQIQAKLKQADEMKQVANAVKVTQRSSDGSVSVTVDQNGVVSALDLTDAALRKQPAQLSAEILGAMRTAQAQIAAKMQEVMAPIIGGDSETMGALMGGYHERFPEPEPADPAPRRPAGPSDDDDFGGHNFARDNKGW